LRITRKHRVSPHALSPSAAFLSRRLWRWCSGPPAGRCWTPRTSATSIESRCSHAAARSAWSTWTRRPAPCATEARTLMRILVVEDEPALQQLVRSQLEAQGYTVDSTGEGKEGLYLATEYPYDAAIVDIGLPGLSGRDSGSRPGSRGSPLRILVPTPRGRWRDRVQGWETGPNDYLTKP